MFRGNHPARVDEKGRLKVPAAFKRELEELSEMKVFITSRDGKRAEIYPMSRWEKIEEEMKGMPSSEAKEHFQDATSYYGQEAEIDSQGRVLIPQHLREDATLTGDVAVLGLQRFLAVVNNEMHRAKLQQNPVTPAVMDALKLTEI
jgi:MraZ protein